MQWTQVPLWLHLESLPALLEAGERGAQQVSKHMEEDHHTHLICTSRPTIQD